MKAQDFLFSAADGIADALGLLRRKFPVERMLEQARRRTGLDDFGEDDIVTPLRCLLDSCVAESELSLLGRIATGWDVMRFLGNLLRLRQAASETPAIGRERIVAPIFVTGLPRSGTSFLHMLLMQDPANTVPLVWQTIFPCSDPSARPGRSDRRIARVQRQLRAFERLAPEFRSLHPLEATSPQECSEITAHVFASLRFDTTYRVPSYLDWLDRTGHLAAYGFHRRFLQHLQYQQRAQSQDPDGCRWVLKCPDHVFALDEIRAVYPDARVVFVHRDPLKVLLSVARLTEVLRRPFVRRTDPAEIGRQVSGRWLAGTQRMIASCAGPSSAASPCHIQYRNLVADPLGTVEALYDHFGLSLSPAAADAIRRHVQAQPNGGYGVHRYRAADYAIDLDAERERFAFYRDRFDIAPESGEVRAGASRQAAQVFLASPSPPAAA